MKLKNILNIVISVLLMLTLVACSTADNGYFEGLEWGMSLNAVNNSTKRLLVATADGNATSEDTTPIKDVECQSLAITKVNYIFSGDKLCEVVVNGEPASSYKSLDVLEELKKIFSSKYTFKDEEANSYRWETPTSIISATVFDSRIIITYSQDTKKP